MEDDSKNLKRLYDKRFQDQSNEFKEESMAASDGFSAYTQQGVYAVTSSQNEEASLISDEVLNNFFNPINFDNERRQRMDEMTADHLNDDWYTRTHDDEDDLYWLEEYLDLHSSDGFFDVKEEEYRERICNC
ncbi:hypothetical protein Tco_0788036 [Tanacetum coccineum]